QRLSVPGGGVPGGLSRACPALPARAHPRRADGCDHHRGRAGDLCPARCAVRGQNRSRRAPAYQGDGRRELRRRAQGAGRGPALAGQGGARKGFAASEQAMTRNTPEEQLILVDERNRATGSAGKNPIHRARLPPPAFLVFLVGARGALLGQQRNPAKYHSGGLWANSCCGHPRYGERTIAAARRRLGEELGVTSALSFGFFARYQAALGNGMHENEFVYVYFGRLKSAPRPDPSEIADI